MNLPVVFWGLLVGSVPILAVTVTGIVIAVVRRARHPRVSVLAALGLSALTLNDLGGVAVRVYLQVAARTGQHLLPFMDWLVLMDISRYALNVSGVALITWAIFSSRQPSPGTQRSPPPAMR